MNGAAEPGIRPVGRSLAATQAAILGEIFREMPAEARILDIGCGAGDGVQDWIDLGFRAYGCDFQFKRGRCTAELANSGCISLIESAPYRLPYPDASFDIVVTNQVMEHVQDYPATLTEMRRVLKPDGIALHIFPARGMPLEPHVHVPLATVIRARWWLAIWALLGIRKPGQEKMSWREVAGVNRAYLLSKTNYLGRRALIDQFTAAFGTVIFAERLFLKHSPNRRGRVLYHLGIVFPPVFWLYRNFWSCAVLLRA